MSEWGDVAKQSVGQSLSDAKVSVGTSIDDSPDDAGRAVELAQASGVPANVIYNNMDAFQRLHKATLANQIVQGNSKLEQYVNSHPMAAKVSNDDYAQLDSVSQSLDKVHTPSLWDDIGDVYKGIWKGLSDIPSELGGQITPASFPEMEKATRDYMAVHGMPPERIEQEIQTLRGRAVRSDVGQNLLFAIPMAIAAPGIGAFHHYVSKPIEQTTGFPAETTEGLTMAGLAAVGIGAHYIRAGKVPPVGLDPAIDALHKEQSRADLKNLQEAQQEVQKSATLERSPEMMKHFVQQWGDQTLEISAEAVRKLYGDEVPGTDDGKLGYVKNLAEQMASAEEVGGKISIPMADWLVKTDPDVMKELLDDVSTRPQGLTKNEMKELEPPEGETPVDPVEAIRKASGLDPVLEPQRKLTLQRATSPALDEAAAKGMHTFDLMDDKGEAAGHVDVTESSNGKKLFIDNIQSIDEKAGAFGLRLIRGLLPQIAKEFPNAEEVEGTRTTGARFAAKGEEGIQKVTMKLPKPKPPQQLELPEMTRMEDRELFEKANAIGMTVDRYKRYINTIEKRNAEDAEAQEKRVTAATAKRHTREWKENRKELRRGVADEYRNRPDVAADSLFTDGILHGNKLGFKPRLSSEGLTDEQKVALKDYIRRDGILADDLAGEFGYSTGSEFINRVAQYKQLREQSGMKPKEFTERMINAETDRQMEVKYGNLGENIISDVKDQLFSDTQLDILHQETVHLAELAGAQLPISKEQIRYGMRKKIGDAMLPNVDSDKFLALAGKAGRAMEDAWLRGEVGDAFKLSQQKELAYMYAAEAKKYEKERVKFDKDMKKLSAREPSGIDKDYVAFIHDIMTRVGLPVKASVQDIAQRIENTDTKDLNSFVTKMSALFRPIVVADFLLDPNFREKLDTMDLDSFRALRDSLKTLEQAGRDEKKLYSGGEEADLIVKKQAIIDELRRFPDMPLDTTREGKMLTKGIKTYGVAHLQIESIINRIDRGNPWGPMSQWAMRGLVESSHQFAKFQRDYGKMWREAADRNKLKDRIENNLFVDQYNQEPLAMNRRNLRRVMTYIGSPSGMDALTRGYKVEPTEVMAWVNKHATEADWKWVRAYGKIAEQAFDESVKMYRALDEVGGEKIETWPVQTPFGTFDGWYGPIRYDTRQPQGSARLRGATLMEDNYGVVRPSAGYMKKRTRYQGPVSLDYDDLPAALKQTLFDTAMRPGIINASKIFLDKDVNSTIVHTFGEHYAKLLEPYLRDVANTANYRDEVQKTFDYWLEFARQNIIGNLIGFNPSTVLKHTPTALINSMNEVGGVKFLDAMRSMFSVNEDLGERNFRFAMRESGELPMRTRHYEETIYGAQAEQLGERSLRQTIMRIGSWPVAMGDLLSAVPTWLAEYKTTMEETGNHGDAVYMADRAVRRAHGSMTMTNRPRVLRGNALSQTFTSLYGFFSHIQNRQYEMGWRAKDLITGQTTSEGEKIPAMKESMRLSAMLFAYIIAPAIIEELVTPIRTGKEGWLLYGAEIIARDLASSWVGVREVAAAVLGGHESTLGVLSESAKAVTEAVQDLGKKKTYTKQGAGKFLRHGAQAFGAVTGWTNAAEGKAAEFIWNYTHGYEHPKGPWQYGVGLRYGVTKGHSQSFQDYVKSMTGLR